jgi:hypothetical protein
MAYGLAFLAVIPSITCQFTTTSISTVLAQMKVQIQLDHFWRLVSRRGTRITAGAMAHVTVEIEPRRTALFTTGLLGQNCLPSIQTEVDFDQTRHVT